MYIYIYFFNLTWLPLLRLDKGPESRAGHGRANGVSVFWRKAAPSFLQRHDDQLQHQFCGGYDSRSGAFAADMLGSAGPGSGHLPFRHPLLTTLFAKIRGPLPHFAPPRGEQVPPQKRRMERRGGPEERRETLTNPKGKN